MTTLAPRYLAFYANSAARTLAMALILLLTTTGGTPFSASASKSMTRHSPDPVVLPATSNILDAAPTTSMTGNASSPTGAPLAPTYPDLPGLPRRVDLSRWDMPAGDQGYVGSCTAWATIYSLVGWWAQRHHLAGAPFAPMPIYHRETDGQDLGSRVVSNLVDGMAGLVPMGFYPQGNFDFRSPMTPREQRIAQHYRIADWYVVYQPSSFNTDFGTYFPPDDARQAIERSLAQGFPVVVSISVFKAMRTVDAAHPYIDQSMARSGFLGGHAVFASHYDEHGLWIENQWGLDWGRNGYAELSWDFVRKYVDGALTMDGLTVDRPAPLPAVTHGPARMRVSGVLRPGHEVVITGTGFPPGAVVTLYRDGALAGRWPVTPWGTFQTQAYFHPHEGIGPHNYRWSPGRHTLLVRSGSGTQAWATLLVR